MNNNQLIVDQKQLIQSFEIEVPMQEFNIEHFKKSLQLCRHFIIAHQIMSFLGLFGYIIRKVYIVIVVNIFSLALSWLGLHGNLKFNKNITALYAVITSSLFGMLLVYQVIDYLFSRHYDTEAPSETYVLFLLSIPYIIDFVSGLLSLKLSIYVFSLKNIDIGWKYDELYVIKTNTGQVLSHDNQFILQQQIEKNKKCILCEQNDINTVFYKCGHKLACLECFKTLKKRRQLNCPICRSVIIDCIQQFEV